jgi:hypothetical protein
MSFRKLVWLFPIVVTIHNAEEEFWLPQWMQHSALWLAPVAPAVFLFSLSVLTLLAFAVTYLSFRTGPQTLWTYLAVGYIVAMLANVLVPHVIASFLTQSYMPGLATALGLNLPVLSFLLGLSWRERYVSGRKAAGCFVVVPLVLLASLPALFRLGGALGL